MNLFGIIDFTNIFIAVFIGAYVFAKNTSGRLNRFFFLNCLLAAYTGYCEYFRLTAPNESIALFWHKASFLWPFFPAVFTKLTLVLVESKYDKKNAFTFFLILPGLFISCMHVFTDNLYEKLILTDYGWIHVISHNVFSIIIPVYVALTALFSITEIIKYFVKQSEKRKRMQIIFATIGLSIPFITGFVSEDLLPKLDIRIPPVTALSFLIGTCFLAVSLLKYNIFVPDPLTTMHQLFSTIEDYLILYDYEGKIIHASKSFIKCLCSNGKDILNDQLGDYFYYDNKPVKTELLELTGREVELNIITCSNEIIPISAITSVVTDNLRTEKLYLLIGRDLRERKRYENELFEMHRELEKNVIERTAELAKTNHKLKLEIEERINIEEALRKSEKSFKDLFNNSPIGIYRTTPDGKILLGNPALLKMLKYESLQDLSKVNLEKDENLAHIYSRAEFRQKVEREGEIKGYEGTWLKKDNTIIIVREYAKCIYDENGSVLYYDGTVEDITEQVLAAEALRESEEKFKILSEQSPNIIAIYQGGRILYVNDRFVELTGYGKEYLTSATFEFQSIIFNTPQINISSAEFLSGEKALTSDISIIHKNGSIIEGILSLRSINYSGQKAILAIVTDITERVKIEKELKESEERYRGLVESINEIYYTAGNHGRINYVSPNVEVFTGYKPEELIGKTAFNLVYKTDLSRVLRFYIDSIKNGMVDLSIEFQSKKKDNSIIWVEQLTRILRDANGNLAEYRSVVRDITERKNTENALKESEERYRSIFEKTSAVMLLIDPYDGSIKGANKAASNYYGYKTEEFLRMNISDIDASPNIDPILFLITPDEDRNENFHHKRANGEIRDVEVHSGLIKMNKKDVIFSIVLDITKRRQAENQLEEYKNHLENLVAERTQSFNKVNKLLELELCKLKRAEEDIQNQVSFLRTLIDTIPNPIFIRDSNKCYTDCNKAFEIFYGINKSDLLGKTVFDIHSITNAEFVNHKDEELLKNSGTQKYEVTVPDINGNEHDLLAYRVAFTKGDGSIGGIIGTLIDITEIKKLEKEVRSALEKEKELSGLKSRFISVASHEFRTPLTSILASADLLEMYGRKWPESKYYEYVGHIQKAVEYMTELINDVLTVSRADTNKIQFNPEKLNMHDLVNSIIESAIFLASNSVKINLEYNLEQEILFLDKKLITQILSNLLTNAIKYSVTDGVVDLRINRDRGYLVLEVQDYGIGISEEDQQRLFEPFHRGQNVGTISGTGLGLSIAKKSAEIHNGTIMVKSKLNEGTTFIVMLNME